MTLVLAHGVFDLLHLGHIKHLRAAHAMGDTLTVSITADRFVNKGPGRPVFSASERTEQLYALRCVDSVVLSDAPNAVGVIDLIKPDIFVKGSDYRETIDPDERAAVESYGGKVAFTDTPMMSSSALINRHMSPHEPAVAEYLAGIRGELAAILEWFDRIKDYRVLLVGDVILDVYENVIPMGKPPKESILAARSVGRQEYEGGVSAVAAYLSPFIAEVSVACVPRLVRKTRFVDPTQNRKLFEIYHVDNDEPLDDRERRIFDQRLFDKAVEGDLVIAADFGHGALAPSTIEVLCKHSFCLAVMCQTNSANLGYNLITQYRRADYICLDEHEARLATKDRVSPLPDVARVLTEWPDCSKMVITQGREGCLAWQYNHGSYQIPAFAKQPVDTMGAGDAFLAVTAPLVAAGMPMRLAGFVGNVMAALKVGKVGHQPIAKPDLIAAITGLLK